MATCCRIKRFTVWNRAQNGFTNEERLEMVQDLDNIKDFH